MKKALRLFGIFAALTSFVISFAACSGEATESGVTPTKTLTTISLNTSNAKTAFNVGDVFSADGVSVTANYSDGTNSTVSISECTFTISGTEYTSGTIVLSNPGSFTVTVTYSEKNATYEIKVTTEASSNTSSLDSYVSTKYANLATEVRTSQSSWSAGNCHDPKLFQDDDGTYYVYATDASCGNVEKTGLNIRYSTDLVNWTTLSYSAFQGHWDEDFLAWEGFTAKSSDTAHSNSSYTAVSWAPTVIKQNDLYYMYHGVNADVSITNTSSSTSTIAASSIVLAIASSAKGPFYPASYISSYTGTDSDITAIKSKLTELSVTYKQNFLVRYCPYYYTNKGSSDSTNGVLTSSISSNGAKLDGTSLSVPDYNSCNNCRYGCIDPEFVFDVATGKLMEYTIGSNTCYAITYGSWMNGIVLAYVDAVSLKPVALGNFSVDDTSYTLGDELDFSLDYAACTSSVTNAMTGHSNSNATDRFLLLGCPLIGGAKSSSMPNNGASTAYEGAQLFYNSNTNYYYMISSCGGLMWEYRCALGRSSEINGEYVDAGGKDMWLGTSSYSEYHAIGSKIIGSQVLNGEYSVRSQGGLSVLHGSNGKIYFANHSRVNYLEQYHFLLQIHQMFFNSDGWPVLNQNDYYDDYTDITSDGTESLSPLTASEISGDYDTILTVRGTTSSTASACGIYDGNSDKVNAEDATTTESKTMTLYEDGSIGGTDENYTGTWTLDNDGYSITLVLSDKDENLLGIFKGYVLNAVDWNLKGTSVERRTITFTTLCSDSSATEAGEYFWGNRTGDVTGSSTSKTYAEKYSEATLKATYTMTVTDTAKDDLAWYLYPQWGTWSYVVDNGDGEESDIASVSGASAWWAGQAGHITDKYSVSDGDTLTFYFWTSDTTCTMIIEGYSTSASAYADVNYHNTDAGWGDCVSAWGANDSRTAIEANAAQSIKVEISRSGTTQILKVYQK